MTNGSVEGGIGNDELVADLSSNQAIEGDYYNGYYARNLQYWRVDGQGNRIQVVGAGSSGLDIQSYLSYGGVNYVGAQTGLVFLSYSNVEKVSLTALALNDSSYGYGFGDDLLIAVGQGGKYVGGSGTDTLYADWSVNTVSAVFDSSLGDEQIVNGVTISGIERFLLKLGSGEDGRGEPVRAAVVGAVLARRAGDPLRDWSRAARPPVPARQPVRGGLRQSGIQGLELRCGRPYRTGIHRAASWGRRPAGCGPVSRLRPLALSRAAGPRAYRRVLRARRRLGPAAASRT